MAACASEVRAPHTSPASWKMTPSSFTSSHTGLSDAPVSTRASYPARLRYVPNGPPELDDARSPVIGEIAETSKRALDGAPVPESGPVALTTTSAVYDFTTDTRTGETIHVEHHLAEDAGGHHLAAHPRAAIVRTPRMVCHLARGEIDPQHAPHPPVGA